MKNPYKKHFLISALSLFAFLTLTALLMFVDVKSIGPNGSSVGLATLNGWTHNLFGLNMTLYDITDWAGLLPVFIALSFAVIGLCQLIKRKSIMQVDSSILTLGVFYLIVFGAYMFFEGCVVNYRPVLINGFLEASYPSSTTLLAACIMPTAMMQYSRMIKNKKTVCTINAVCAVFTAMMIIGRLISGVHWLTDIVAGVLLSVSFVTLYAAVNEYIAYRKNEKR
ncbi:MAG TPA: phosphatase PAP2 family protein [Bacillota bacterium]|nr:phosphatase PAP2 family protein [Bacillota bacterium]